MAKRKEKTEVFEQTCIAPGIYDMWIETSMTDEVKPGQFVMIYPDNASQLLPRPISICEVDHEENRIRIVYRVVGNGTSEFSAYQSGKSVSLLGPLGNGYDIQLAKGKKVVLLGGGIGIPPMLQLAKSLQSVETKEIVMVAGYRDSQLFLDEDFMKYTSFQIATEDGSLGTKGNVLDVLRENNIEADIIFACGPMPMLKAIKQYANELQIDAYISLEERMACGVGACLGCVCTTKNVDHHSKVHNARVCTDGPVFEAREVEI